MQRFRVISIVILAGLVFVAALHTETLAQSGSNESPPPCDPVMSGLASLAIPGWGQHLNSDPQRKSIIHFSVGLVSTLAMIYRWTQEDGRIFRTIRILWSFWSGMEAYGTCSAKQSAI